MKVIITNRCKIPGLGRGPITAPIDVTIEDLKRFDILGIRYEFVDKTTNIESGFALKKSKHDDTYKNIILKTEKEEVEDDGIVYPLENKELEEKIRVVKLGKRITPEEPVVEEPKEEIKDEIIEETVEEEKSEEIIEEENKNEEEQTELNEKEEEIIEKEPENKEEKKEIEEKTEEVIEEEQPNDNEKSENEKEVKEEPEENDIKKEFKYSEADIENLTKKELKVILDENNVEYKYADTLPILKEKVLSIKK